MTDPWYDEDVAFSHDDADAAIEALKHVRLYVVALRDVREQASTDAIDGWTGRFYDDYARELISTQGGLDDVVTTIDTAIGSINDAKTNATEDQNNRVRLREEDESDTPGRTGPR